MPKIWVVSLKEFMCEAHSWCPYHQCLEKQHQATFTQSYWWAIFQLVFSAVEADTIEAVRFRPFATYKNFKAKRV